MKATAVILGTITAVLYILFALRSAKLFKTVAQAAACGICFCIALHIAGVVLDFNFPLNAYRLVFCSVTGLPGAVGLIVADMLFYM